MANIIWNHFWEVSGWFLLLPYSHMKKRDSKKEAPKFLSLQENSEVAID